MYKKLMLLLGSTFASIALGGIAHADSLIGMVNNGNIYVKSGANTSQWTMQLTSGTGATKLQIAGDRVAYVDSSGSLWLKNGLNSTWHLEANNISSYSLATNGLLVLANGGTVGYKAGSDPDGQWDSNAIATNAHAVYLSKSQMVVIDQSNNLIGKVLTPLDGNGAAGPDGSWNLIATNAASAAVTDSRLVYVDASGNVRGKEGPIWYSWWNNDQVIDTTTTAVALNGTMYCAEFSRGGTGVVSCKPYTFSDSPMQVFVDQSHATISELSLAPGRIVVKGDAGDGGTYLRGIDYSGITAASGGYGLVTSGWKVQSNTGTEITTNGQ